MRTRCCIVCENEPDALIDLHGVLYCLPCLRDAHPRAYEQVSAFCLDHKPRTRGRIIMNGKAVAWSWRTGGYVECL